MLYEVITRTWRKAKPKIEKKFRCNEQIKVPKVFLIGDDGDNVGVIATTEARKMAEDVITSYSIHYTKLYEIIKKQSYIYANRDGLCCLTF